MTAQRTQHVHFLGIGGTGLSPLAQIHLAGGGTVSGSDSQDSPRVATLRARGVAIRVGGTPDPATLAAELAGVDVVVASSALPDDHPEIVAARALGLPVRRRTEWLPELTAGHRLVAVAGSHGKSTTSAMLTLVLRAAGLDPTAVIGAEVSQLGGNALAGSGDVFVLESDEYGGAFAGLEPTIAIITNVEWEHPDIFPDEASVRTAFTAFARRVRPGGRLIVYADDPGVTAVLAELDRQGFRDGVTVVDYGFAPDRTWRAVDVETTAEDDITRARVLHDGQPVGSLALPVPGRHSVLNALAALASAADLGVAPEQALATLGTFTGAGRRFEFVGFWNGAVQASGAPQPRTAPQDAPQDAPRRAGDVAGSWGTDPHHDAAAAASGAGAGRSGPEVGGGTGRAATLEVVDDYAHHPTEIRLTLAAARSRARGRQIWAVLQPHTFSRFGALLDDFATAFEDADRLYVTDIYASRETDDLGLHPNDLVRRVTRPVATVHVPWPELVARLAEDIRGALVPGGAIPAAPGVLLLTLGAGTITTVGPRLLEALRVPAQQKSGV